MKICFSFGLLLLGLSFTAASETLVIQGVTLIDRGDAGENVKVSLIIKDGV